MKKLVAFLCGICLLASCEDIDDVHILPKDFSVGDFVELSELTYDELERLEMNAAYQDQAYLKEEMRREGGFIVRSMVNAKEGEAYDEAYLWLSEKVENLPDNNEEWWNENVRGVEAVNKDAQSVSFYVRPWDFMDLQENSSSPIYYRVALRSWESGHPGFVDECLGKDSQSSYSEVKSWVKETPLIRDVYMEQRPIIDMSFAVRSTYPVTEYGVCYSSDKQLPDSADEVASNFLFEGEVNQEFTAYVTALPREAGTYYVRGFAKSEKGISYSPVHKIECQGSYVEAKMDTVVNVSNLSYSELEKMASAVSADYYDAIVSNSGLLFMASVNEDGYSYQNIEINAEGYYTSSLSPINEDRARPIFFHSFLGDESNKFSYRMNLSVYVDNFGDYTYSPWQKEYVMSEEPTIQNCTVAAASTSFVVRTTSAVTRAGICYSTSDEFPLIQNAQTMDATQNGTEYYYVNHEDGALAPGTYYIRAFAVSEKGTGYSPVRKITIN